jgi:glucose-6-phosphate 1-dehydrogenase
MSGPFDDPDCLGPLGEHLERLDATQGTEGRRLYYCATPPSAFPVIVRRHRDAVDHVQITVAEAVGMECRGAYYEEAGALRDMAQNHLLQVLSFLAMEPPGALDPEAIRDEKVKLLRALRRSLRSL